ncbi:hypothetical protein [Halomonas getboli]|uniref:hypothetical protein n=1 Tax=Halomonas getboli TaxID=2935862 RepID=UPI001FFE4B6B|nr:hypothetical protein [Halomonas getboli]MCK2183541.1 hypothetical protein [Halomonas getboli]
MSIVDQTLRQLIRSRVHEITDLAEEISDRMIYAVDVEQSGQFGAIAITIFELTGHGEGLKAQEPISVTLPGNYHRRDDWLDTLDRLEEIAQQLRTIRHGGQPS